MNVLIGRWTYSTCNQVHTGINKLKKQTNIVKFMLFMQSESKMQHHDMMTQIDEIV